MTPVFQRIVALGNGDCMRAAVASVLDLPYEDVPDLSGPMQGLELAEWLNATGRPAIHLDQWHLKPHSNPEVLGGRPWDAREMLRFDYAAGAIAIASVPSQKFPGGWHAIVVRFTMQPEGWVRLECVHDPNPGNAPYDMETTEIRHLTFIMRAG
ncbi:MAG TPA: hypothetical protein PK948_08165 [Gemmatimonadales bacterium]|nr:hypothetical protein [Gemmatimonadales bacterium]